jgi:hypothetical protein
MHFEATRYGYGRQSRGSRKGLGGDPPNAAVRPSHGARGRGKAAPQDASSPICDEARGESCTGAGDVTPSAR